MRSAHVSPVLDVAGNELTKGDTVTTISGGLTARVCGITFDFDCAFVQLRPMHQPFGKGIWHAADQVLRLSSPKRPEGGKPKAGGLFRASGAKPKLVGHALEAHLRGRRRGGASAAGSGRSRAKAAEPSRGHPLARAHSLRKAR